MKKSASAAAGMTLGLVLALQGICAGYGGMAEPKGNNPQNGSKAPAAEQAMVISGKVTETMDSGGYTYANLEKDGKKVWVAFPTGGKIAVGQELSVISEMQAGSYTSRSLKRTFERIFFASGVLQETNRQLPQGHPEPDAGDRGSKGAATNAGPGAKGHLGTLPETGKDLLTASGKVVQVLQSGTYTYLHLEKDGKKIWAGVPTTEVAVGQELTLQPGQEFKNFKSKSLNRTFESMILSNGVVAGK